MRLVLTLGLLLLLAGCAEFDYRGGTAPSPAPSSSPRSAPPGVHVVERGDTLYAIAWRHGLDFREVGRWNGIEAPYRIYPGQRIRLRRPPGGGQAAATRSAPSETPRTATPRPEPEPPAPRATEEVDTAGADDPASTDTAPPAREREDAGGSAGSADAGAGGEPGWQWPTDGEVIRTFSASSSGKRGIRIAGSPGATVRAAAGGRVVYSGDGLRGYGNLVIIKHNARYLTAYGYNRELMVGEGDEVSAGAAIARMGTIPGTGEPALHFEIRRDGKPTDPMARLPSR